MGSNQRADETTIAAVTPTLFYGDRLPKYGPYVWADSADEAVACIREGQRVVSDSPDLLVFTLSQLGLPLGEARASVHRAMFGLPELKRETLEQPGT